ncbi:MAG TPA: hypothetical protein VJ962_10090 [Clostridia bacterium]|nr:hypothetical protein [Clostridia bacterium]
MELFLNVVLYIVVAIILVVFFRKAIEVFLLLTHKISRKNKKEKDQDD